MVSEPLFKTVYPGEISWRFCST